MIRTKLACPSKDEEIECVAEDSVHGHQFDLSVLRRKASNWLLSGTSQGIEINVCAPLVRTAALEALPDGACRDGLASCIVKT